MRRIPEYTSDDNMFFYINTVADVVNELYKSDAARKEQISLILDTLEILLTKSINLTDENMKLKEDIWIEFEKIRHALIDHYRDPQAHEPTDDKPEARHKDYGDNKSAITWKGKVDLGQVDKLPSYEATLPTVRTDDTHRTVTLRIPKGKRIGEAIVDAWYYTGRYDTQFYSWVLNAIDTKLTQALEELEGSDENH